MRIAICDDQTIFLDSFADKVRLVFANYQISAEICKFSDGDTLIDTHAAEPFDVIFLDIDMPSVDGFTAASSIQKSSGELYIIFVSSKNELVYQSFHFHPFHFIRKECVDEELPRAVGDLVQHWIKRNKTYEFMVNSKMVHLHLGDILYFESYKNNLNLVAVQETFTFRGSISAQERELGEWGFIRIHSGYLVNYQHIYHIGRDTVKLDTGAELPLSRHRQENVKKKFQEFIRKKI